MTTAAIRALTSELKQAQHDLEETKAATADDIRKGETAKARLLAAQREVTEITEAIDHLERQQKEHEHDA